MASKLEGRSPIWPNIKLVQDFFLSLFTCKFEEDPIKNEAITLTFFQERVTLALMPFLVTRKFDKDPIKNESAIVKALLCLQHSPHYNSMGIFFQCSRASNSKVNSQIWQEIESVRHFLLVLITKSVRKI